MYYCQHKLKRRKKNNRVGLGARLRVFVLVCVALIPALFSNKTQELVHPITCSWSLCDKIVDGEEPTLCMQSRCWYFCGTTAIHTCRVWLVAVIGISWGQTLFSPDVQREERGTLIVCVCVHSVYRTHCACLCAYCTPDTLDLYVHAWIVNFNRLCVQYLLLVLWTSTSALECIKGHDKKCGIEWKTGQKQDRKWTQKEICHTPQI